jgi:signal transduction histidine kinase
MANAPADTQRRRFAILQQTLIARSRPGVRFYPGAALLYIPFAIHEPVGLVAALTATILLVGLAIARRIFYRETGRRTWAPERWRTTFQVLSSASIAIFDSLMAFEALRRSLDFNCIALIACSIAIRASATYTTCPDLRVHDSFARWTRVPVFVALIVIGTSMSFFLFLLLATHMLYLHKQSRQLNEEFWQAIQEREERERIEMELRLAQKLESVGRLAAGIAHEINTPLQAMMGNLEFMREGVDELLAMANPKPDEVDELQYLKDNLPESFVVTQECLERTAAIVRSVKRFAHPETSTKAMLDLNAALQSTLDIARHEYAMVADTKTDFGNVPLVECYTGEVNQALLNIVVNAAHAISDVFERTGVRGTIRVSTHVVDDAVSIEIADTGGGIPDTIRDRIFDPFFTTKEVGKGTGQGLALAHSVAVRHGGDLAFETHLGHGTTFVMRLPLTIVEHAAA